MLVVLKKPVRFVHIFLSRFVIASLWRVWRVWGVLAKLETRFDAMMERSLTVHF